MNKLERFKNFEMVPIKVSNSKYRKYEITGTTIKLEDVNNFEDLAIIIPKGMVAVRQYGFSGRFYFYFKDVFHFDINYNSYHIFTTDTIDYSLASLHQIDGIKLGFYWGDTEHNFIPIKLNGKWCTWSDDEEDEWEDWEEELNEGVKTIPTWNEEIKPLPNELLYKGRVTEKTTTTLKLALKVRDNVTKTTNTVRTNTLSDLTVEQLTFLQGEITKALLTKEQKNE